MLRRYIGVVMLGVAALAGCDKHPLSTSARATDAENRLFDAMRGDDFAAVGDILGTMYDIRSDDPTNHRNTFLLAATSLWWIAEADRPGANGLNIISQTIPIMLDAFPDVIQSDPTDRAVATALFGAFLYNSGFDKVNGSLLVEQAVTQFPEVGLFQRMHIRRNAYWSDSLTADAVEAGFNFWETCAGTHIDRTNPDFTPWVQPPLNDGSQKRFCFGSSRVPHGFEGSWLIFGDLLVKAGQLTQAKRAYLNAQLGANYATWKYKGELEQRLLQDLSQRHATYLPTDPTGWATIGVPPFECTQCHANASP